jgi:hypothetical protein
MDSTIGESDLYPENAANALGCVGPSLVPTVSFVERNRSSFLTGESFGNVQHAYYRGIEKLRVYLRESDRRTNKTEDSEVTVSLFRRFRNVARDIKGSEVKIVKARAL